MRTDEEAQAVGQPAEEGLTAANGHDSSEQGKEAEKPAQQTDDAVITEDRIEVKLEGKEHPWNWTKTQYLGSFSPTTMFMLNHSIPQSMVHYNTSSTDDVQRHHHVLCPVWRSPSIFSKLWYQQRSNWPSCFPIPGWILRGTLRYRTIERDMGKKAAFYCLHGPLYYFQWR